MGFIVFNIEIHGLSPLMDAEMYKNISNAFGDYPFNKLDDKDNYYYKSVYMGCVRAIDFLCGLPEFDGKNVVVTGGSQGGALSIVTAGLDKRAFCGSHHPYKFLYIQFSTFTQNRLFFIQILLSVGSVVELGFN